MLKMMRNITVCFLAAAFFWCGGLLADRQRLDEELIRFHVVANSDSPEDQQIKRKVRDAVLASMENALREAGNVEAAQEYLRQNLGKIQQVANDTLRELGCEDSAVVTFCREKFGARASELVALPAGFYQALRIRIGEGAGENWWGVIFPELFPAAAIRDGTESIPASLMDSLNQTEGTEIRFYLLDKLGQLENYLRKE